MFDRISFNLGVGVGIASGIGILRTALWPWSILFIVIGGPFIVLFTVGIIHFIGALLEEYVNSFGGRLVLIICGAFVVFVIWAVGPGAAWAGVTRVSIAVLPAALLLCFGMWACLLTQRRVRASRYRWARAAPKALVPVLIGLDLLVLFDRDLLTTVPAAGLLFPVGVWASIGIWRAMTGSRRVAVRAGADIILSLLLGADLVLFLVWAANLLNLPEAEIAVLRGTLERIGSIADLPWSLWVGLYVALAATSLVFALRPGKLTAAARWAERVPIVSSIDASRRILTVAHIGLLVVVLIAISAPESLEAALRGPLKAKYTVALQRELESHGEQLAYEAIRRQFTTTPNTPLSPSVQPLAAIVSKIHNISSPAPGTSDATSTERDLARRLGQLQITTLQLVATNPVLSAHQAVTDLARFEHPIRDADDLNDRLDKLDTEQQKTDTASRRINQIGELATTAVANMLQIPNLGESEIIQILREYLSGLVESSPLKDVFAAWAERLTGATTPPPADMTVVPDAERLQQAAAAALTQEKARVQLTDPTAPDQAEINTRIESPINAAVDLVNEARYLDQHTGPCDGCQQPSSPGDDEHRKGPGVDRPGEPVDPDIHLPIIGW